MCMYALIAGSDDVCVYRDRRHNIDGKFDVLVAAVVNPKSTTAIPATSVEIKGSLSINNSTSPASTNSNTRELSDAAPNRE